MSTEELNIHISKVLNNMAETFNKKYGTSVYKFFVDNGEIKVNIAANCVPMEDMANILSEFNNTLRQYGKSKRNENAFTHNKIAKHSMHLLRLYMMAIDLLEKGEIVTKRTKEHDLLMDIRNGKYLDENGKPTKEFFEIVRDYEEKFEYAKINSVLPRNPDVKAIKQLQINIQEMYM